MGTFFDYLDWRGDLSLLTDPFNEVDSLMFCELAYAHIEPYVTGEERISIAEASERYFAGENNPDYVLGVEALKRMGESPRFKDLEIHDLKVITSRPIQFGAMCIDLPGDTTYIVFRGTDESINGWREDFAISYKQTFSQRMAIKYLENRISDINRKYIVGGHSKGGNLAVFASMRLSEEKQDLILQIYDFDGPGIPDERFNAKKFARIKDKILRFAPSYSVVGRLFERDLPAVTISSCEKGIQQHDAKSWQVLGKELVRTDFIPDDCKLTNIILKNWIDSATLTEREAFTKEFFDAFEVRGSETIAEFKRKGLIGTLNLVHSVAHFSSNAKRAFNKLLKSASRNTLHSGTEKMSHAISWLLQKTKRQAHTQEEHLNESEQKQGVT